jgi:ectoine hydroxylase-related dioxygenase (phytanoyl-CoA dioxygenase family)
MNARSFEKAPHYGVLRQTSSDTLVEQIAESINLVGFAVVESSYGRNDLAKLSSVFDRVLAATHQSNGGREELATIDEHNTIRLPLASDSMFLELALNPLMLAICRRLMGDYIVLNLQNGIVNPPNAQRYNVGAYHRDLPYQHFVSSHPVMVNALFCLDPFTTENGATYAIPASHKVEAFPSDAAVSAHQQQISAPEGSFIIMDSMVFHRGGVNSTNRPRRAINQAYSIPIIRQQIDLPAALGPDYTSDADIRKLLGYDVQTPTSIAAYYEGRRVRKAKPVAGN